MLCLLAGDVNEAWHQNRLHDLDPEAVREAVERPAVQSVGYSLLALRNGVAAATIDFRV